MSENTNTAVIKVVADASEAEAGFRKVDEAAARTGRNLDNLGKGDTGFSKIGADGVAAAAQVDKSSKAIADSYKAQQAAALEAVKASASYYATLNDSKGAGAEAAAAFLKQIEALTAAEQQRAQTFEKGLAETRSLLDIASVASIQARKALGDVRLDGEQLTVPDSAIESINNWKEALAVAAGTAFGGAIVAAKAGYEAVTNYIEYQVAKRVIGTVSKLAAEIVGVAYAIYKTIDFGIGLLTGESYKSENIDLLISANKELVAMQKNFRLSANEAAGLNATLKAVGVSSSDYTDAFRDAADAVKSNKDEMDALGVTYKDAAGALLPLRDVLVNVQTELSKYTDGIERNAVASALGFGSSEKIDEALKVTAERLATVTARQAEYGLLISGPQQAEIKRYTQAMTDFNAELENTAGGFSRVIADAIMPALTNFAEFFKDGFPSAVRAFRGSVATLTSLFYGLKTVFDIAIEAIKINFDIIPDSFKGVSSALGNLINGDFKAVANDLVGIWDGAVARFGKAGDKIVEYARANTNAIKLSWGQELFPDEVALKLPTLKTADSAKEAIANAADKAKEASSYKDLIQASKDATEAINLELAAGEKLTDAQKKGLAFAKELAKGKSSLTDEIKREYTESINAQAAAEKAQLAQQAGQKAAAAAAAAASAAADKQAADYANLISSIEAKTEANRLELATGIGATESQKASFKLDRELASGKRELAAETLTLVRAKLAEQAVTERLLLAQKSEKASLAFILQSTAARLASRDALQSEYELYGKTAEERELANISLRSEVDLQKKINDAREAGNAFSEEQVAQMRREKEFSDEKLKSYASQRQGLGIAEQLAKENKKFAAEEIADARARAEALLQIDADEMLRRVKTVEVGTEARRKAEEEYQLWLANQQKRLTFDVDTTKANELLTIMTALDDVARDAAAGLAEQFGKVGKAIGGMTTALSGFGKEQAAIAAKKQFDLANAFGDPRKIAEANQRASAATTSAQLKEYGQLADAASNFFGEQSKGYQVVHAAAQVFYAAQLAMNLASIAPAMAAGAAQFFAQSGWGGFAGVAAMAAVVAGFGVAVSKSGDFGGAKAVDVQKMQGTGGVLGDDSAKSNSIAKSLSRIEGGTFQGVAYSAGMLKALQNIEASMAGLGNIIAGQPGVAQGTNFDVQTGVISKTTGNAFTDGVAKALSVVPIFNIIGRIAQNFGKTSQSVVDSGLRFGGSVRGLQNGQGFDQYASVNTTKSSFFGLVKNTSNSVLTQSLSKELTDQLSLVFTNVEESLKSAAVAMGLGSDLVGNALSNLVLDVTKISLKDLKGDELTAALNAVISKALDDISAAAFPSFEEFRKVGEGYAETVLRIAQDFVAIDTVFASFGKTFGAIGLDSIAAREKLIELSGGLENFTKQGEFFLQNFFSEDEQNAALSKRIKPTLDKYGVSLTGADPRDAFKQAVLGQNTETLAGAEAYAALQAIAPAFIQITKVVEDARKQLEETNKGYQDQIDIILKSRLTSDQLKEAREAEIKLMATSTQELVRRLDTLQAEEKATADAKAAAEALTATNEGWLKQIADFERAGMTAAEVRALEVKGMKASTLVLYERLEGLKKERQAAVDAIKAVADVVTGLLNALELAKTAAATAMASVTASVNDAKATAQKTFDDRTKELDKQEAAARKQYDDLSAPIKAAQAAAKTALAESLKLVDDERIKVVDAYKTAVDGVKNAQKSAADAYKAQVTAIKSERDLAVKAYGEATKVIGTQIKAVTDTVSKLGALSSSLSSTLSGLRLSGADGIYRAQAQSQISGALATARAGGGLPDAKDLTEALRTISQPSEQLFSTFEDYQRDFYKTALDIRDLNTLAGDQLYQAENELQVLESTRDLMTLHHEELLAKLDEQQTALEAANEAMQAAFAAQLEGMAAAQDSLLKSLDERKDSLNAAFSLADTGFETALKGLSDALEQSLKDIQQARDDASGILAEKLKGLEELLAQAQKDYELQLGIYKAVEPLNQALDNLKSALTGLGGAQQAAAGAAPISDQARLFAQEIYEKVQNAGGYAYVQQGNQALIDQIKPSLDEIASAESLYRSTLGREADGNSGAALAALIKNGLGIDGAREALINSFEGQARAISVTLQQEVNKLVNEALRTGINPANLFKLDGSHAGGLSSVPFDGYRAELHQGEMVVPAALASILRGSGTTPTDPAVMAELIAEVKELRKAIEKGDAANVEVAKRTADNLDQVIAEGLKERT